MQEENPLKNSYILAFDDSQGHQKKTSWTLERVRRRCRYCLQRGSFNVAITTKLARQI